MSLQVESSFRHFAKTPSRARVHRKTQLFDLNLIFTKPKAERTSQDIESAIKFLKALPFFSSLERPELDIDGLLAEFFDMMECESYKQGETIFNYKDKPSKFYVILKGEVDVCMPKTEEEQKNDIIKLEDLIRTKIESLRNDYLAQENQLKFRRRSSIMKSNDQETSKRQELIKSTLNLDSMNLDDLLKLPGSQDYVQINHEELTSKFKKIKSISPGGYFGELALSTNSSRSAKIVAASDLCVAALCKEDYAKILRHFERDIRDKIDFFMHLMGMEPDKKAKVAKFCYEFRERKYAYGQTIFKQGETPQEIFVVKQGEVQISVKESFEKESYLGPHAIAKKEKRSVEKLANFGAYTLLGERELSCSEPYGTTATAISSDTVLYVISVKDFQYLKTSYGLLLDHLLTKHKTEGIYLKNRAETLNAFEKDNRSRRSSTKGPPVMLNKDSHQVHSLKFLKQKIQQISLPKLQEKPRKERSQGPADSPYSVSFYKNKNEDTMPPISLFSELTPRGDHSISKSPRKSMIKLKGGDTSCTSTEFSPRKNKDISSFGEYFVRATQNSSRLENDKGETASLFDQRFLPSQCVQKIKNWRIQDEKFGSQSMLLKSLRTPRTNKEFSVDEHDNSSTGYESVIHTERSALNGRVKEPRCSIMYHLK